MKKKHIVGLVAVVLVVVLAFVGYLVYEASPKTAAVTRFMKGYAGLDNKAVADLIVDKTAISTYNLAKVENSTLKTYLVEKSKKVGYSVKGIEEVDEKTAKVTIEIEYTDAQNVIKRAYVLYGEKKADKQISAEEATSLIEASFKESIATEKEVRKTMKTVVVIEKKGERVWVVDSVSQDLVEAYYSNVYGKLK